MPLEEGEGVEGMDDPGRMEQEGLELGEQLEDALAADDEAGSAVS